MERRVVEAAERGALGVLFTAFEPSGDAHAAPIIAELKRRAPDVAVYAWGGPKMERAGAVIIERSAEDGAMGLGALKRAGYVRRQIAAIKRWSKAHRVLVHVPVDSPAANFPICKALRKGGARTVHLVAPQLWAWGPWRIGKLRRRTDLVLCLLPFEEAWFRERRVPARFIGHPAVNRELDAAALRNEAAMFPKGTPRVVILPGSRSGEVRKNIRFLMRVYHEAQTRHADVCGLIVAANARLAQMIRDTFDVLPTGVHVVSANADAAIHWCDCALAVSGTISLDLARQRKPMVGVYRVGGFARALALVLLRTKHRLLPNILAGRRIVPEFVPYAGGPMKVAMAMSPMLSDTKVLATQAAELDRVVRLFDGKNPAKEGADLVLRVLRRQPLD
jgi:lipid-A-disaccharide synthase